MVDGRTSTELDEVGRSTDRDHFSMGDQWSKFIRSLVENFLSVGVGQRKIIDGDGRVNQIRKSVFSHQ
jgi:hypothetical protein